MLRALQSLPDALATRRSVGAWWTREVWGRPGGRRGEVPGLGIEAGGLRDGGLQRQELGGFGVGGSSGNIVAEEIGKAYGSGAVLIDQWDGAGVQRAALHRAEGHDGGRGLRLGGECPSGQWAGSMENAPQEVCTNPNRAGYDSLWRDGSL